MGERRCCDAEADIMTTLHGLWDTTRMHLLVALERHGSLSQAARSIGIGR